MGAPQIQTASDARLTELYVTQGLGVRGVAAAIGMSATYTGRRLRKNGIARPQMLHPDLRRDFFDQIDTPEKAYILGLLWADGTIDAGTQQARIRLAEDDRELLLKIAEHMGSSGVQEIPATGNAVTPQVGLYISSKRVVSSLIRLGLTQRKDYTLPQAVLPHESIRRDFVRGLVDGDGCLTFSGGTTPRISFRNRNESLRSCVSDYWFGITGETANLDATVQAGCIYPSVYLLAQASVIAAKDLYRDGDLMMARKRAVADKFLGWMPHRRGRQ